jgi:lysozyme family protein
MSLPYTPALAREYQDLWDSCVAKPTKAQRIDERAQLLLQNKGRYKAVALTAGCPWQVVAVIHSMEADCNFKCHLHNGDPLTARTTHVPAGRPASGSPPFTWEQSATDALTMQGLNKWTDWSVPGALYKLEAYNGFGYRDHHPDVNTPYLWSFTNHYTRGKYVADGSFSASAVSQQCGAAAILRRLAETGAIQLGKLAPRTFQLTNPYMTGPDIEDAQRLLADNRFGNFAPGEPDGEYGPVTADATWRAKQALGYPLKQVDGVFGPVLKAYLSGEKPLPPGYEKLRAKRLADAPDEAAIRAKIVEWALWGVKNKANIAYSQGPSRLAWLDGPGSLPLATDCSAFATLCYAWAGAPNPNFDGAYAAAAGGYTGTLLKRCRHVPRSAAKPGDLVVWTPPADGHHVAILVSTGADPWLASHGSDAGPLRIRFSAEHAAQRRNGHGTPIFLSVFA